LAVVVAVLPGLIGMLRQPIHGEIRLFVDGSFAAVLLLHVGENLIFSSHDEEKRIFLQRFVVVVVVAAAAAADGKVSSKDRVVLR
jgi:uncharacterized oligopeptide transporter (OPT) family protein